MQQDNSPFRVVIPACNEGSRIASTIHNYCGHFGERARVVVVANGCSDDTVEVIQSLKCIYPSLFLVDIPGRIGKGGAVRVGFSSGDEQFIGFVDADGSTSAKEFRNLLEALDDPAVDGVIGSRWSPGSVVENHQPALRRLASRTFNAIVRLFFGLPFRDTQCGAKVFRRSAIEKVLGRLEVSNFAFDIDLLLQLSRSGARVLELPIRWADEALRSQVQLVPASASMLAAVLRLRLRDSLISRLPIFDYLARRSVIPVRERLSLLVLSDRADEAPDDEAFRFVREYVRRWQASGHTVSWIKMDSTALLERLRMFLWYAFFGRVEYDAILEIPSQLPFFIPAWSVKRCFLITGEQRIARDLSNRLYERFYKGVTHFDVTAPERAGDAYEELLQRVKSSSRYGAVFEKDGSGDWSLHFNDMTSGITRRQRL